MVKQLSMKPVPRRRAFALILVLIMLVLVATMAVLFLSSAGRERRGVDFYARSSQVRNFARMAVNRVMGQINAATKEGTAGVPVSWASQPGMVRTYDASGNGKDIYKLYSWDSDFLQTAATFDGASPAENPSATWSSDVALFTDLNQPSVSADQSGNVAYPIVDPRAAGTVAGFTIDPAKASFAMSGTSAPMPVKWLYVLEDGRMVAPAGGSGTIATFSGSVVPSTANPIVGRVAFWTDDETSKVNVNTASEGAYWDWPKAATYDEMQFAGNPPVTGEYNRTPGHPAMTSLSAIFPELDPGQRWSGVADYRTKLSTMLGLSPRVAYSGSSSRGGTYPIETANYNYGPVGSLPAIPNAPLPPKAERLYVSPDEMIFTWPNRTQQAAVTADMLQKRSFFLTAQSRAPETTLFETPRVSLWPVTWPYPSAHAVLANRQVASASLLDPNTTLVSKNPWMRAEERLLAFVSTLNQQRADGGDRYYFQRQRPDSPTADYDAITRNQDLLSYLQNLTSRDLPGYGGNFAQKYGAATRDSILGNEFNVVRSLVNQYTLQDDGKMLYSFTPVAFTKFTKTNGSVVSNYVESGAFSPIPMKLNLGTGEVVTISEFPTLREAALVFYATARKEPEHKASPAETYSGTTKLNTFANPRNWNNLINLDSTNGYPVGAMTTEMRAVLILDFGPVRGATLNNAPVFWVKVTGDNLAANGQKLGLDGAVAKMDFRGIGTLHNFPSYLLPFYKKDSANGTASGIQTFTHGAVNASNYGLISVPVTIPKDSIQFPFSGGPVTISIYAPNSADLDSDPTGNSSLLMASATIDFSVWTGNYPNPLAPRWNYYELNSAQSSDSDRVIPNPNFEASDPAKMATKWADLEIAPPYRSGISAFDPAENPTGYSSVPTYTTLFRKNNPDDGTIAVPASLTGLGQAVIYAYRDSAGGRMTDFAKRIGFIPSVTNVSDVCMADNQGFGGTLNGSIGYAYVGGFPAVTAYDTVLSMVADPQGTGNGDPRLAQKFRFARADQAVGTGALMRQVMPLADYRRTNPQYHTLGAANENPPATGYITTGLYGLLGKGIAPNGMAIVGAAANSGKLGATGSSWSDSDAVGVNSALPQSLVANGSSAGDWSSQPGYLPDGGSVQRADQDFQAFSTPSTSGLDYQTPYFRMQSSSQDGLDSSAARGYFSPNRQVPSPISLLGAIPSSLARGWQTLLFSPNPAAGSTHPGLASPPDYLFLDLFWMPVVEPYPISEEFSTAGKVNLNYQMAPFRYLKRRTALNALLKSTWITALNNSLARDYKAHDIVKGEANAQTRYQIDVDQTLDGFDQAVFNAGDLFRSAAQLCAMWLVPQGYSLSSVQSFWGDKLLTSDTAREQPYDNLYSRVTTKSNTYTVHWRAQALRKSPAGQPAVWDETRDHVAADLRGSTLVERYLDPNATDIPDYARTLDATPLSRYYKWRVVSENFFQP